MRNQRHKIQLTQSLFETLLKQQNKSIMINTERKFSEGDLIKIEEITSVTNIATGRSDEYLILRIRILKMTAYKNLQIIYLRKYFEFQ